MTQITQDKLLGILNDPANKDLLSMDNAEVYKGYDIYEQNGSTIASAFVDGGVQVYSLQSVGNLTRQALKTKIDTL